MRIRIVPFGNIPVDILKEVAEELRYTFNMVPEFESQVGLPREFYNDLRHQFLAPQILKFISKNFKGRILGITDEDMYAEDLNYVFGQAELRGNAAVISLARLKEEFHHKPKSDSLLLKRAVKEAVHEVGHLLGLKHCENTGCVMNFSNNVIEVDRKGKELCDMCKLQLGI